MTKDRSNVCTVIADNEYCCILYEYDLRQLEYLFYIVPLLNSLDALPSSRPDGMVCCRCIDEGCAHLHFARFGSQQAFELLNLVDRKAAGLVTTDVACCPSSLHLHSLDIF